MKTLLGIFTLIFLVSCGNSFEFKESPIPQFRGTFPVEAITFESINNQILKPNCIQCHAGYSDYETVFSERESILDAVLKERMPKNAPALDDNLKALLNAWVEAGAPLGDENTLPVPIKLLANWESLSKEVIIPKCIQCHNPDGMAGFLDLSTRQKFFEQRHELLNNFEDVENSHLVKAITGPEASMPPTWSGIEQLNEEEVKTLIEWIKKGLP